LSILYFLLEVVKRRYGERTYIKKKEVKRDSSRGEKQIFERIKRIIFFYYFFVTASVV